MDRRTFLLSSAVLTSAARFGTSRTHAPSRTRLILLGTAGGPRPRIGRFSTSQVIVVNDAAYVVDCGNGVTRQLVAAGLPLRALRDVLLTHHHSDHNADYGTLLLLAWTGGLQTPVDTWGPPPLVHMTELFFEMSATDLEARIADERRVPLRPLVRAHDLVAGGVVFRDENVKVTSAIVDHAPMNPAFAYRLDSADRSIVISGDTTRSDNLIALARDADILVHEVMYPPAVDRLVSNVPNAPDLKRSILAHHTTPEDAGRVAKAARVKTLVLSHLIPADDPLVTEAMWLDAARSQFDGTVVLGRDLLEL